MIRHTRFALVSLVCLVLASPVAAPPGHAATLVGSKGRPRSASPAKRQPPRRLRLSVQPAQLFVNRDVQLHIRVTDDRGKPLDGVIVSVLGADYPVEQASHHGSVTMTVHTHQLGRATVRAGITGYSAAAAPLPIVLGPPADVLAIKAGLQVRAPRASAVNGRIGMNLFSNYHATTGKNQFGSLGLRDGTLVDLNQDTDVMIIDPLNQRLTAGELFMEVVHGSVSHHVHVGSAVAATKGTRLDVRTSARTRTSVVRVIEGRVQVTNAGRSVLVGAGQQTTIVGARPPTPPKPTNLRPILVWVYHIPNSTSNVVPPVLVLPTPPGLPTPLHPIHGPGFTPGANPPVTVQPPAPPSGTPVTVTGSIVDRTLTRGVYLLQGQVDVPAKSTLTIAPGSVLEMAGNAYLVVGGTLMAQGTADAPIVFTSASAKPAPGDWGFVQIATAAGSPTSTLDHVQMFYGGGKIYGVLAGIELYVTDGAAPMVRNSAFAQSAGTGVTANGGTRPTLTDDVFADNGGVPLSLPPDDAGLLTGARFGAGSGPVYIRAGSVANDATWQRQDVPYELDGGVSVAAKVALTLAPGSVLEMTGNAYLVVGGTLTARGTADAPIVFTSASAKPVPGDWGFVQIATAAGTPASTLDHVQMFYGGGKIYGVLAGIELLVSGGPAPLVRDCAFVQSAGTGVTVADGGQASVQNSQFYDDAGFAISLPTADTAHVRGNRFGPGQQGIQVRGH